MNALKYYIKCLEFNNLDVYPLHMRIERAYFRMKNYLELLKTSDNGTICHKNSEGSRYSSLLEKTDDKKIDNEKNPKIIIDNETYVFVITYHSDTLDIKATHKEEFYEWKLSIKLIIDLPCKGNKNSFIYISSSNLYQIFKQFEEGTLSQNYSITLPTDFVNLKSKSQLPFDLKLGDDLGTNTLYLKRLKINEKKRNELKLAYFKEKLEKEYQAKYQQLESDCKEKIRQLEYNHVPQTRCVELLENLIKKDIVKII